MNHEVALDVAGMLAVRARLARLQEAALVVGPGGDGDPAVARHARELFGDLPEPGRPTKEPHRLAVLEWIGQPSPRDSPLILALRANGLLFRDKVAMLERMVRRTVRRADGVTSRSLTKEREGLAETYRWGPFPGTYVRSVRFADADRILGLFETGAEFRIVGTHQASGPARRPDDDWRRLIDAWRRGRGLAPLPPDALSLRYGPDQGLRKIIGAGGDWTPLGAWKGPRSWHTAKSQGASKIWADTS